MKIVLFYSLYKPKDLENVQFENIRLNIYHVLLLFNVITVLGQNLLTTYLGHSCLGRSALVCLDKAVIRKTQ